MSSDWVSQHMRAGQDVFAAEVAAAGFELTHDVRLPGLRETYVLIFDRRR